MIDAKIAVDLRPLDGLKPVPMKAILRKAIRVASKPTLSAVRANAGQAKLYGFLKKTIAVKFKTYKSTVVAVVGPRSKMVFERGVRTRGAHKGEAIRHRPAFYEHFLERGGKRLKPKPVLKPALDSTGNTYLSTMTDEVGRLVIQQLKTGK